MSKTDYIATANPAGAIRIHRASCKKVPVALESRPLNELQSAALVDAILASCCKPKAAQVYIDEAIDALRRNPEPALCTWGTGGDPVNGCDTPATGPDGLCDEHRAAMAVLEGKLDEDLIAERQPLTTDIPEARAEPEDLIGAVLDGVSKHYHDALRRTHATRVEALAAFAALKVWRRTDADYKALPSQDTHWATSERYAWERDFLVGYMAGLAGSDAQKTYAATIKPARRGHKAATTEYVEA